MNDLMIKHIPAEQRVLRDWNGLTEAEQRQASRSEILHELTINNSWRAMSRYTRSQILMTPSDHILELINVRVEDSWTSNMELRRIVEGNIGC